MHDPTSVLNTACLTSSFHTTNINRPPSSHPRVPALQT
jgi:hypothetical protein